MKKLTVEQLLRDLEKSEKQRLNQMEVISQFQTGLSRLLFDCDTGVAFWQDAEDKLIKLLNGATVKRSEVCDHPVEYAEEPAKGHSIFCKKCKCFYHKP